MTDRALKLLYSRKPRVDGGYRLRLALECLIREVAPDADDAFVSIKGELDWSAVRSRGSNVLIRSALFGRAFEQRQRLGTLVGSVYPDALRAYAVFYRAGEVIGILELPMPGRP